MRHLATVLADSSLDLSVVILLVKDDAGDLRVERVAIDREEMLDKLNDIGIGNGQYLLFGNR